MNKFKVGDIVIGNSKANKYGITKQGVLVKVDGNSYNDYYFTGNIVGGTAKDNKHALAIPGTYVCGLEYDCFDLYKPITPINLATDKDSANLIYISCCGNQVTAELAGTNIVAEARCNPTDTFDYKFGARLALERLFNKITIDVNDTVKIKTLAYSVYTDYLRFVDEILPQYITNFVKGKKPDLSKQYVVLAKHQHLDVDTYGMTYIIQDKDTSQVFVVAEKGIEKVSD